MKFRWTAISCLLVIVAALVVSACGGRAGDQKPEPVTVTLNVAGMTCESCEQAIIHTVGQLPGVEMVESRHAAGTTTVLYRPQTVSREKIVETIEGLGYKVLASEE